MPPNRARAAAAARGGHPRRSGSRPKFVTMLVIGLIALVLLLTRKMRNAVKVPILLLSTFLYGIAANLPIKLFAGFSMHPSPICAATKSILYGFRPPMIAMLIVILGPDALWARSSSAAGSARSAPSRSSSPCWPTSSASAAANGTSGSRRACGSAILLLFVFLSGTAILHTAAQSGTDRRAFALRLHQRLPRLRDRPPADLARQRLPLPALRADPGLRVRLLPALLLTSSAPSGS
ncbi:MAG: hypothetical protein MZV64_28965 [Ignavibacteriales bacterium]|nr:hypothetical protein [Ignavibacteriales bacterium]